MLILLYFLEWCALLERRFTGKQVQYLLLPPSEQIRVSTLGLSGCLQFTLLQGRMFSPFGFSH
jgi:hypothetical protein